MTAAPQACPAAGLPPRGMGPHAVKPQGGKVLGRDPVFQHAAVAVHHSKTIVAVEAQQSMPDPAVELVLVCAGPSIRCWEWRGLGRSEVAWVAKTRSGKIGRKGMVSDGRAGKVKQAT